MYTRQKYFRCFFYLYNIDNLEKTKKNLIPVLYKANIWRIWILICKIFIIKVLNLEKASKEH